MDLSKVKTFPEILIEDMSKSIIEEGLLYGYDFHEKVGGIRRLMLLVELTHLKNEKIDDPFQLVQEKLETIEASSHCYIKYDIALIGTDRTIWENDWCEIIDNKDKKKKVFIKELEYHPETESHELSYQEEGHENTTVSVGGVNMFSYLLKEDALKEKMRRDPVSKMKYKPEGETEFFDFKEYRHHLVSQNHLIEQGQSVRVMKDGVEYILKYRGYAFATKKATFKEGDLVHYMSLKDFDKLQILEVIEDF